MTPKGGAEALRPYFGKWLAITEEGGVVASGDTFDLVADAAQAAGARDPGYMFVPSGPFMR